MLHAVQLVTTFAPGTSGKPRIFRRLSLHQMIGFTGSLYQYRYKRANSINLEVT